jgi:hypothetical protein
MNLRKTNVFFKVFGNKNEVSVEEALLLSEINEQDKKKGRQWIINRLFSWKKRRLVEPVYGRIRNYRILIGMRLTDSGMVMIGRPEPQIDKSEPQAYHPKKENDEINTSDIIDIFSKLHRCLPERELKMVISNGLISIHISHDRLQP